MNQEQKLRVALLGTIWNLDHTRVLQIYCLKNVNVSSFPFFIFILKIIKKTLLFF